MVAEISLDWLSANRDRMLSRDGSVLHAAAAAINTKHSTISSPDRMSRGTWRGVAKT